MNMMRKLPIGIQDFEKLRTNNCVYVDKTQYVYHLAYFGKPYFLGRPRRFGKSLFLSTLKAFFEGKKELFEGLKIAELETEWTKYPVIYIDLSKDTYDSLDKLNSVLSGILSEYECFYKINNTYSSNSARFYDLLQTVHKTTGKRVVVLVDDYDKPLRDNFENIEIYQSIHKPLLGFYSVFKSSDAHTHFYLLSGITKIPFEMLSGDLNQLFDISLDNRYSGICGITQAELEENFVPEITELAEHSKMSYDETLAKLKKLYDGYHFAKVSADIYNPFSVLNTFGKLDFGYYWFATGTPTFLAKTLQNQNYEIRKLETDVKISANSIMDYRAENQNLVPLLYQSGYLTIKSYVQDEDAYVLGFPNEEVKYGFLNELLPAFVLTPITTGKFSILDFLQQLKSGDIDGFMTSLQAFFADIPYDAIKQKHRDEQYYQHVFYLLFTLMGQFVQTEVKSNKGRADAVVKTVGNIYVFEFKMDDNATAEDALAQINSKDYTIPYSTDGRKLVKIGVEFSQTERGVKRWLIE